MDVYTQFLYLLQSLLFLSKPTSFRLNKSTESMDTNFVTKSSYELNQPVEVNTFH